jgi:hypothetical protein
MLCAAYYSTNIHHKGVVFQFVAEVLIKAVPMFTFAAKPRIVRLRQSASLSFPATVTLRAKLGPPWLFGAGGVEPRHVVAGSTGVSLFFNANTGKWYAGGGTQPRAVRGTSTAVGFLIELVGDTASVTFEAQEVDQIVDVANLLLYGLPLVLGIHLQFPCFVEHVIGQTSGGAFGYEAQELVLEAVLVDEDDQDARARRALDNLVLFTMPHLRRVQAALVYFTRSGRLLDAGHTRWEFMSEAVLNLAKVLESLFPPAGDGKTRDAVRKGLAALGYSEDEVEEWFIPALALRSEMDVAHVWLAMLASDQIEALTAYADNAINRFRGLITKVIQGSIDGDVQIPEYMPAAADSKATATIDAVTARIKARGFFAPEA